MFESFCQSCAARQNPGTSDARHVKAAACVCFSMNDNPAQPPLSNLILIMINATSQIVAIAETGACKVTLPLNCQPMLASKLKSDSLLASLRYHSTALSSCQVQPRNSFQSAVFLVLIASSASYLFLEVIRFLLVINLISQPSVEELVLGDPDIEFLCMQRDTSKWFSSPQGRFPSFNHTTVIVSTQSFPPHGTLPVNEKLLASERNLRIVVPFLKNLTIYLVYGAEKTNQDKCARGPCLCVLVGVRVLNRRCCWWPRGRSR